MDILHHMNRTSNARSHNIQALYGITRSMKLVPFLNLITHRPFTSSIHLKLMPKLNRLLHLHFDFRIQV